MAGRPAASATGLSPVRIGNLCATVVHAAYELSGAEAWLPQGDGTTADFIATRGAITPKTAARMERVQIKAARYIYRDGVPVAVVASLRNPTGMKRQCDGLGADMVCYRRTEIDAFALATPDGRVFRLTADDLIVGEGSAFPTTVTLRLALAANGQSKGIRFAAPYELPVPDALRALMPSMARRDAMTLAV